MESSHLEGTLTVCPFEKFSARRLLSFKVKDFAFEGNEENQDAHSDTSNLRIFQEITLPAMDSHRRFSKTSNLDQRSVLSRRKGPMIAVNPSQPSLHDVHREGMSETTAPTDDIRRVF